MKRSFSTIGDQCVNGLWQEQHSLERVSPDDTYRPRQRSYRGHILPPQTIWKIFNFSFALTLCFCLFKGGKRDGTTYLQHAMKSGIQLCYILVCQLGKLECSFIIV